MNMIRLEQTEFPSAVEKLTATGTSHAKTSWVEEGSNGSISPTRRELSIVRINNLKVVRWLVLHR